MTPLKISWSSLRVWDECHQKGMLQRTGKRNKTVDQRVFFPGTVCDRVARDWVMNDPENNLGMMPEMVEDYIGKEINEISEQGGKMVWKDPADRADVLKTCIEAVTKLEADLVEHVLPFDYEADFRFTAPLMLPTPAGDMESVILRGAMDFLVRDDKGRWSVIDLKITRDNGYWRKTVGQLAFYDLAVALLFEEYSSNAGLLQPLASPTWFPYPITDDMRTVMLQRIGRMANDLWRENYEPRDDSTICGFCDVKHACIKFKPVEKSNGKRTISLI